MIKSLNAGGTDHKLPAETGGGVDEEANRRENTHLLHLDLLIIRNYPGIFRRWVFFSSPN